MPIIANCHNLKEKRGRIWEWKCNECTKWKNENVIKTPKPQKLQQKLQHGSFHSTFLGFSVSFPTSSSTSAQLFSSAKSCSHISTVPSGTKTTGSWWFLFWYSPTWLNGRECCKKTLVPKMCEFLHFMWLNGLNVMWLLLIVLGCLAFSFMFKKRCSSWCPTVKHNSQ